MRIIHFEFLIPRRPVSLQTKKRENLQAWKNFVRVEAQKVWKDNSPIKDGDLQLTLVYLCDEFPADRCYKFLREDPKYPSLHFKKVGQFWSVRIGIHYRALAIEEDDNFVWFWIGSHSEYDKLLSGK